MPNLHLPSALNSAVQSLCLHSAMGYTITKGLYTPVPLSLLIPVIIHLFSHVLFILILQSLFSFDCKACFLFSCFSAPFAFPKVKHSKGQTYLLIMIHLTLMLFPGVPPCCGGAVKHHSSLAGAPPGFPH